MLASKSLLSQSRLDAKSDLTEFLQSAGFVIKESSGFYSYTTLGHLALQKIENTLRAALVRAHLTEWQLSLLQSQSLWEQTGRDQDYGDELMAVKLRSGNVMRLSATAEEQITNLARQFLNGRHVDHHFFQIGAKWRDEVRARGGLIRGREFRMMDAYHFAQDEKSMHDQNDRVRQVLVDYLISLGCEVRVVEADCGEVGGLSSHELQVKTDLDDTGWLEVGHCFALGDRYARAFDLKSAAGSFVSMSCQGLGTSRLLAVLLNARRSGISLLGDEKFHVIDDVIVAIGKTEQTRERAKKLHDELVAQGRTVLLDDRFDRAGAQLMGSESIGARHRWIVSDRLGDGVAERYDFASKETMTQALSF